MPKLSMQSNAIARLMGACLTSLSLLLVAACSRGDQPSTDSAVLTDSAGGHATTPDTATAAPSNTATPAAPSPASTAPRDTAKTAAPTRTATSPARGTTDTSRRTSTPSKSTMPSPRPGMRPVARDTAPGMMVPAPEKVPEPAPSQSSTQQPAQQPTQQPAQQASGQANLTVSQSEYNGWKTFAVNCTRCHGEDAIGSALAPSLLKSLQGNVNHEVFLTTVKNGRPEKGMPAWGGLLSDAQIEDIWAYVKARADGRLAAGRPRVRSGG